MGNSPRGRDWAQRRLTFLYLFIGEEEDTPNRKWVIWSEKLLFLYLFIGEEEDTPNRKWVIWSESLGQRLGTAEAAISVLVYR